MKLFLPLIFWVLGIAGVVAGVVAGVLTCGALTTEGTENTELGLWLGF